MLAKYYQQIQVIMAVLGYYEGKCDGAWGPKSIEAMRQWEMQDSFEPAIPRNGMPFTGRGQLPDGMMYGQGVSIISEHLTSERGLELLKTPLMCLSDIEKAHGVEKSNAPEKKAQYSHVEVKQEQPIVVETQVDHVASSPDAPVVDEAKDNKEDSKKDNWLQNKK